MAEPRPTAALQTASGPMRWVMLALAIASLVLGVIGIFVPVPNVSWGPPSRAGSP